MSPLRWSQLEGPRRPSWQADSSSYMKVLSPPPCSGLLLLISSGVTSSAGLGGVTLNDSTNNHVGQRNSDGERRFHVAGQRSMLEKEEEDIKGRGSPLHTGGT